LNHHIAKFELVFIIDLVHSQNLIRYGVVFPKITFLDVVEIIRKIL